MTRRASDVLLDILRDEGITHIFGNPGSTQMPLMDALVNAPDITYVLGLQEATAVGMADGWALTSGKTGFVNLHAMGGLGNAMGVLVASKASETPLVVTAGQQDTRHLMTEPWLPAISFRCAGSEAAPAGAPPVRSQRTTTSGDGELGGGARNGLGGPAPATRHDHLLMRQAARGLAGGASPSQPPPLPGSSACAGAAPAGGAPHQPSGSPRSAPGGGRGQRLRAGRRRAVGARVLAVGGRHLLAPAGGVRRPRCHPALRHARRRDPPRRRAPARRADRRPLLRALPAGAAARNRRPPAGSPRPRLQAPATGVGRGRSAAGDRRAAGGARAARRRRGRRPGRAPGARRPQRAGRALRASALRQPAARARRPRAAAPSGRPAPEFDAPGGRARRRPAPAPPLARRRPADRRAVARRAAPPRRPAAAAAAARALFGWISGRAGRCDHRRERARRPAPTARIPVDLAGRPDRGRELPWARAPLRPRPQGPRSRPPRSLRARPRGPGRDGGARPADRAAAGDAPAPGGAPARRDAGTVAGAPAGAGPDPGPDPGAGARRRRGAALAAHRAQHGRSGR